MTSDEIRAVVLQALHRVAPEAEPDTIEPDVSLREQLDIDSMDFLRFVTALHEALRVDIPETAYPNLSTIDGCVNYLSTAVSNQPTTEA
jgi:acyl carrier protein